MVVLIGPHYKSPLYQLFLVHGPKPTFFQPKIGPKWSKNGPKCHFNTIPGFICLNVNLGSFKRPKGLMKGTE